MEVSAVAVTLIPSTPVVLVFVEESKSAINRCALNIYSCAKHYFKQPHSYFVCYMRLIIQKSKSLEQFLGAITSHSDNKAWMHDQDGRKQDTAC